MNIRWLLSFVIVFSVQSALAQNPEELNPLLSPAPSPRTSDLQTTANQITDMVNQNRDAVNMHQNILHSFYPDLRKISYADGVLTLKPS